MIRIYYVEPVDSTYRYNAYNRSQLIINNRKTLKRPKGVLSFSQHLELVESLLNK